MDSNTTLVKVKYNLYAKLLVQDYDSNTTLVKVKSSPAFWAFIILSIQIQHLLKLNLKIYTYHWGDVLIQIQHLLKLNLL